MLLMGIDVEEGYTSSPTFNGRRPDSPTLSDSFESLKAKPRRDRKIS